MLLSENQRMKKQRVLLGSIVVLTLMIALLAYKMLVDKEFEGKLTFKNCTVFYSQYTSGERPVYEGHSVTNEMEFAAANLKLALCLCEEYKKMKDSDIADKLMVIYQQYSNFKDEKYTTVDSLIKYRETVFNPAILIY